MTEWTLPGYVSLRELGRGGFGRVVLARHEASGTYVAIKYLTQGDPEFRASFRAEARTLMTLSDPYVVRLFEYVETPQGAAIVMEAIDGVSLKAMLAEAGPLAPEAALVVLKGSLLGLSAAHRVGVVHRDYKPDNVMVRDSGQSTLIDFGIALRSGEPGVAVGTPPYMAPEQWDGAPASPSTDVYAATCVFFECVTGRKPYEGDYRTQHRAAPIPVDAVPVQVRGLLLHGLAKSPAGRPPDAYRFVTELETAARNGFGPQWESDGWRRLGETAAGLAALFPLAALLGGTTSSAAHLVGSAAGKGAVAKITGVGTAVKTAVVVAGVAVVGAAGTAVVVAQTNHPKHKKPAVVAKPLTVQVADLAPQSTKLNGGASWQLRGQYVTVSGLPNAAVQQKVNAALRRPLDDTFARHRKIMAGFGSAGPYTSTAKAKITLRTRQLVSVEYETNAIGNLGSGWDRVRSVTVDLRDGRGLTPADIFTAATVTTPRPLQRRAEATDHTKGCGTHARPLDHKGLVSGDLDQRALETAFTATGADLSIDYAGLGGEMACGQPTFKVPYTALRTLLRPDFAALLPPAARLPTPAPSHT